MKYLVFACLVACGGAQHTASSSNPTCDDLIEHGYGIIARDLVGDQAIRARRQFVQIRPNLVTACQASDLSLERKRCIMAAETVKAADACELKFP